MGDYAKRLKLIRTERGISRRELTERAGVCYLVIAHAEQGRNTPSLHSTVKLAKALDMTVTELIGV